MRQPAVAALSCGPAGGLLLELKGEVDVALQPGVLPPSCYCLWEPQLIGEVEQVGCSRCSNPACNCMPVVGMCLQEHMACFAARTG